MDLSELIDFAKAFSSLKDCDQNMCTDLFQVEDFSVLNTNQLNRIKLELHGFHDDLDRILGDCLADAEMEEEEREEKEGCSKEQYDSYSERYQQFVDQLRAEGLKVQHYRGRSYFRGPAVITDEYYDFQDICRLTSMKLQRDSFGLQEVVYPC